MFPTNGQIYDWLGRMLDLIAPISMWCVHHIVILILYALILIKAMPLIFDLQDYVVIQLIDGYKAAKFWLKLTFQRRGIHND